MSAVSAPLPRRQALRRTLLLLAFVAFPLTMNYFSPYLIVDASFQGILNGSAIVFGSMFVGSLLQRGEVGARRSRFRTVRVARG